MEGAIQRCLGGRDRVQLPRDQFRERLIGKDHSSGSGQTLNVLTRLFPLDLNRFEVHNGTMHYRDFQSRPQVDLKIDQIHMLGRNFTNSEDLSKKLVATIEASGRALEQGSSA